VHWRQNVQSSVVEHAWDTLCGSIVQEFIYDSWFAMLSPDREFPSEIRRLLNHSFGTLSLRARHLDLRIVLEDACELFMETVELYRDTRESIVIQRPDFLGLPQEAKDELLRREMSAEGNLHPALTSPDGHYKVLRTISDGTVGVLLASEPSQAGKNAAIRAVARELFAGCVLRPVLMYCTPYYANKAMIALLLSEQAKSTEQQGGGGGGALNPAAKQAQPSQQQQEGGTVGVMDDQRAMRGQWEFEQRLLSSAEAEKTPPSTHLLRRVLHHSRSKSVDDALLQPIIDNNNDDRNKCKSTSVSRHQQAISTTTTDCTTSQHTKGEDSYDDIESEASSPGPPIHGLSQKLMSPFEEEAEGNIEKKAASGDGDGQKQQKKVVGSGLQSYALPVMPALPLESLASSAQRDESDTHLIAPSIVNATRITDSSRSMTSNMATAATAVAGKYLLQSNNGSNGGANSGGCAGFTGRPRARVVAAELHTSTFKDFVVYKIRVGDDASEWSISRRYRNFEALHRQLLVYSVYKLKLPPKRIFFHAQTVDFVEERREALDKYLQQLLSSRQLAACSDIYEFLNKESEVYKLPRAAAAAAGRRSNLGPSNEVDATPSRSMPTSSSIDNKHSPPNPIVGLDIKSAHKLKTVLSTSTIANTTTNNNNNNNNNNNYNKGGGGYDDDNDDASGVLYSPASHQSQSSVVSSASEDTVSIGNAFTHHTSATTTTILTTTGKNESNGSMRGGKGMRELSELEEKSIDAIKSGAVRPLRPSPSKLGLFSRKSRPKSASTSRTSSPVRRRHTYPVQPPAVAHKQGIDGTLPVAAVHTNTEQPNYKNNAGPLPPLTDTATVAPPSTSKPPPIPKSFPAAAPDLEDCTGISAPLYEIVDCIFQLQRRGFFRRQVFGMARQVLSLVAGDVIDVFLVNKLRLLRQEHSIARLIHKLQNSLWPGGVWYSYLAGEADQQQEQAEMKTSLDQQASSRTSNNSTTATNKNNSSNTATFKKEEGPLRPPPFLMQSDRYIKPSTPPPPDAEYIKATIKELMLTKMTSSLPLARLVGKGVYTEGMADLHDMMQSEVFMHQLGYGMLELVLFYVFPELKAMFVTLEHGVQHQG